MPRRGRKVWFALDVSHSFFRAICPSTLGSCLSAGYSPLRDRLFRLYHRSRTRWMRRVRISNSKNEPKCKIKPAPNQATPPLLLLPPQTSLPFPPPLSPSSKVTLPCPAICTTSIIILTPDYSHYQTTQAPIITTANPRTKISTSNHQPPPSPPQKPKNSNNYPPSHPPQIDTT